MLQKLNRFGIDQKSGVELGDTCTEKEMSKQANKLTSITAILAYCFSSILMTLVNKFVLSDYKDPPIVFLILASQAFASVFFVNIFSVFKLLSFRSFNLEDGKRWFPVSIFMAIMLYTGGKSLQHLDVALFTIFKNITIIFVAYGEKLVFNSKVTPLMMVSFILMIFSSLIGGWAKVEFDFVGYSWMLANCLSSAIFVLYMRKAIKTVSFKDFDTVYFNNVLTLPIFLVMSLLSEDWPHVQTFYMDPKNAELFSSLCKGIIISGFSAFAISYTSAWCIRVTNSTTYSMVGALNKLPIAIFGMLYFGDAVTVGSLSAVFIGFVAGVIYSKAKTLQQKANANPVANNYHEVDPDSDKIDGPSVLPIAMDELEKRPAV